MRKEPESSAITSFYFEPCDGLPPAPFRPGQFLTFRFRDHARDAEAVRNYSLSGPGPGYRISVKREAPPADRPSLPPGFASNHLHDEINAGDEIDILDPRGSFVLEDRARPVLLLSGGVGQTPLISMAHRLAKEGTRKTWFIHACENGDLHAFRREIAELAAGAGNLRTYFCYNAPTLSDRETGAFDGEGLLTAEKLQSFLPIDDYECYLCGPPGFMQAIYAALTRLGVAETRIHYEFFGPATVLKSGTRAPADPTPASASLPAASAAARSAPGAAIVTFARSGISVPWDDRFNSILDLAEANGLTPDFSCRAGICSSCQCGLKSGSVEYFEELLSDLDEGDALICCSRPVGDVVIDI